MPRISGILENPANGNPITERIIYVRLVRLDTNADKSKLYLSKNAVYQSDSEGAVDIELPATSTLTDEQTYVLEIKGYIPFQFTIEEDITIGALYDDFANRQIPDTSSFSARIQNILNELDLESLEINQNQDEIDAFEARWNNLGTLDKDTNTITDIDAVRIGDGSVDNTEFGHLDGVTDNIQTQITTVSTIATAADVLAKDANALATTADGKADTAQTTATAAALAAKDAQTTADSKLTVVSRDDTLTGDGQNTRLGVANPFTAGDETKLAAQPNAWSSGTYSVRDQVSFMGKIYACIVSRDPDDNDDPATDTTGWAELGTGTGDGGGTTYDSTNRLDADFIAGGDVSNAEFDRLNGVSSPIQTQLDRLDTLASTAEHELSELFDNENYVGTYTETTHGPPRNVSEVHFEATGLRIYVRPTAAQYTTLKGQFEDGQTSTFTDGTDSKVFKVRTITEFDAGAYLLLHGAYVSGQNTDLTGNITISRIALDLADVAKSGNYSDLSGSPVLADVATSGDYDDLSNRPNIPNVVPRPIEGVLPQTITTTSVTTGTVAAGLVSTISVTAVDEDDYFVKDSGTNNISIKKAGTYRLYGDVTFTGSDRTGPSFNVTGTGVEVIGYSNPYARDTDSALTLARELDFTVASDNTVVTLQVMNRIVSTSTTFATQAMSLASVSNLRIIPIGGVAGKDGKDGTGGGGGGITAEEAYDSEIFDTLYLNVDSDGVTSLTTSILTFNNIDTWVPAGMRPTQEDNDGFLIALAVPNNITVPATGDITITPGVGNAITFARSDEKASIDAIGAVGDWYQETHSVGDLQRWQNESLSRKIEGVVTESKGTAVGTPAKKYNFTGNVSVTGTGDEKTINVPDQSFDINEEIFPGITFWATSAQVKRVLSDPLIGLDGLEFFPEYKSYVMDDSIDQPITVIWPATVDIPSGDFTITDTVGTIVSLASANEQSFQGNVDTAGEWFQFERSLNEILWDQNFNVEEIRRHQDNHPHPTAWKGSTEYTAGDQVLYNKKLYKALKDIADTVTANPSTDTANWSPLGRTLTAVEQGKLDDGPGKWQAAIHAVGDQAVWNGKLYECIATRTGSNTANPASDSAGWRAVNGATGGGATFTPSKTNIYSAVKEILHPADQTAVTADDDNNEIDIATGSGTTFTPSKTNIYEAVKDILHPSDQAAVTADDTNSEIDIVSTGEENVQSNWDETNTSSDAHILNKPTNEEIGSIAQKNPDTNLTPAEQSAYRQTIGAGDSSEHTSSYTIEFQNHTSPTETITLVGTGVVAENPTGTAFVTRRTNNFRFQPGQYEVSIDCTIHSDPGKQVWINAIDINNRLLGPVKSWQLIIPNPHKTEGTITNQTLSVFVVKSQVDLEFRMYSSDSRSTGSTNGTVAVTGLEMEFSTYGGTVTDSTNIRTDSEVGEDAAKNVPTNLTIPQKWNFAHDGAGFDRYIVHAMQPVAFTTIGNLTRQGNASADGRFTITAGGSLQTRWPAATYATAKNLIKTGNILHLSSGNSQSRIAITGAVTPRDGDRRIDILGSNFVFADGTTASTFNNGNNVKFDVYKFNASGIDVEVPEKRIEQLTFNNQVDYLTADAWFDTNTFSVIRGGSPNVILTDANSTLTDGFKVLAGAYDLHLVGEFTANENNGILAIDFLDENGTLLGTLGHQYMRQRTVYNHLELSTPHYFASDTIMRIRFDHSDGNLNWRWRNVRFELWER